MTDLLDIAGRVRERARLVFSGEAQLRDVAALVRLRRELQATPAVTKLERSRKHRAQAVSSAAMRQARAVLEADVEKAAEKSSPKRKARPGRRGRVPYSNRAVIRRMVELRRAGLTLSKIADVLNAERVPPPAPGNGRSWAKQTIHRILKRAGGAA